MNGCGCWCFECTNRYAGWHCHGPLCEHDDGVRTVNFVPAEEDDCGW